MSRAQTLEEMRRDLLNHFHDVVERWIDDDLLSFPGVPEFATKKDELRFRAEGVVFNILSALDGCNLGLPSYDVVVRSENQDWYEDEGENWPVDGTVLDSLHDFWYEKEPK